jgi:hypothetical protein
MEQNCTDGTDRLRRHQRLLREVSQVMRHPRVGIDYRRLYSRITVEPFGPTLRGTLLVGNQKWQAEVLLTETGAAIGYTKPHYDPSTGYFGRRRACLGLAMGCVKHEDTELLPFGYDANWEPEWCQV